MTKELKLIKDLTSKAFIYFGLIVAFNQNIVFAQAELHTTSSLPTYPGGIKALKEFITKNLNYPEIAKKAGISGTVQVSFLINKDGKTENIRVIRGISPECDNEAIRVTNLITGWKPARQVGKPINIMVSMPVEFQSDKKLQSIVVTGKVTDKSNGMPLEGTLVIIKGTNIGTITNNDGGYNLEVPGESQYLEFSSIGYGSKVEQIGKNRSINIELDTQYYIIDFNSIEN